MRPALRIAAGLVGLALAVPDPGRPDGLLPFLAGCLRGGIAVWGGALAGPALGELWREARDRAAMRLRWWRTRRNGQQKGARR